MFNKAIVKEILISTYEGHFCHACTQLLISYISFLNDVNYLDRNPTNKTELYIIKKKKKQGHISIM